MSERPKIVWIEWLDSGMNHGWLSKDAVTSKGEDLLCHSIGFLVDENDDMVSVSASWDLSESFADSMTIPKAAITKMQEVDLS